MATATATKLQNFIGGEFVDPADGQTEEVVNPATGEVIAEAPLSTAEDVDRAVAAARGRSTAWATTTPGERALALLQLADAIEERAEELADLESADAGKPRKAFLDDEIPVDGRQPALLRRRGALPRGPRLGGVHWRATPRSSAASRSAWSARSPPGTTR